MGVEAWRLQSRKGTEGVPGSGTGKAQNTLLEALSRGFLLPSPSVLPQGWVEDSRQWLCLWAQPQRAPSPCAPCTCLLTTVLSPEPPAIAPSPSNLTLTAHIPASLPCEASGSPKPLVVWWKDGQKLDFRLQQGAYR